MPSSSHKKRRINKSSRQSICMVDRISDLPDSILCHILYSFPTKFAATTSVLSKRWRYLWLSVLALDFDSNDIKTSTLLCNVMHSTMNRRAITLPIHSFSLKTPRYSFFRCDQQVVNKIVDYVLQREIQNFDLNPCGNSCYWIIELPVTIFSCRTLKTLKLANISMTNISDKVDFDLPSLKSLHLNKVYFEYDHLIKLVLSCPILEDFELIRCPEPYGIENRFTMKFIALPNLIKARISSKSYIPLSMLCKAQILCLEKVLRYACWTEWTQLPNKFQNLTHLELNFTSALFYPRWTSLLKMLKLSPRLQNLIIQDSHTTLEATNKECWKNPPTVPECLLAQLKTCNITNYKAEKYDLEFVKYIIENSKVLDTITINSGLFIYTEAKQQSFMKLSSCTRGSATCKLLLD
ncbi:hypothetical protein P8452_62238 [Trifolium repens]|nr:hypothetical protein P8452_62238 [Trifolium repens]